MHKTTLIATAVAAVLLAGCSTPPTSPATIASSATPAPTQSAAEPTECPNPHGGTCLGPLEPGEYQTSTFEPQFIYTVSAGWTNFEDLPGNFWLFQQQDSQEGVVGGSYLGIYQNVHAAAINCDEEWQKGVGTTPKDLVAWYQSVPGLIVSKPKPVTVGGLDGLQIDLSLQPDVDTCRYGPHTGIPLIIGGGVSDLHHVLLNEIDVRLVILGWQDSNVTLEITNVKEQHSAHEFRSMLQPIIDSLVFKG
ncbi:MAG: hypothetical protein M3277_01850 [Actinomycetota bacterium]|nr:hypothetical protein [Actinomycetota bacterium]